MINLRQNVKKIYHATQSAGADINANPTTGFFSSKHFSETVRENHMKLHNLAQDINIKAKDLAYPEFEGTYLLIIKCQLINQGSQHHNSDQIQAYG